MAQKKETELSKKEDAKMSVKSETKSETQSEIKSEVKSDTKSEMKKAEDTRLINEEQKKGKKEIKITPINEGIVIDHIPAGKALLVAKILDVRNSHNLVTIGINLSSSKMNTKDCVKIEGRTINNYELNKIAVVAPSATVSFIHDKKVEEKFKVKLPKELRNVIKCSNPNCITRHEQVETRFVCENDKFSCFFCERTLVLDEVELL